MHTSFSNPKPTSLGLQNNVIKLIYNLSCLVVVDEAYHLQDQSILVKLKKYDNELC